MAPGRRGGVAAGAMLAHGPGYGQGDATPAMNARNLIAVGLVLVLMGIQLRAVQTFVLNEKTSQFIESRVNRNSAIRDEGLYAADNSYMWAGTTAHKRLTHPRWVGLAFISVGAVMLLHGASRRPG